MKYFLLFCLVIFYSLPGNTQTPREDPYGFEFSMKEFHSRWSIDPGLMQAELKHDSTEYSGDKFPLLITQATHPLLPSPLLLKVNMYKKFYLSSPGEYGHIVIRNKCSDLKDARLILYYYDQNELVVRKDTINLNNENTWSAYSLKLALKNIHFLGLEISAEGKMNTTNSRLWLDKIQLQIDGQAYNAPEKSISLLSSKGTNKLLQLLPVRGKAFHTLMADKRLIGLGETIHGNEQFTIKSFELIYNWIQNANCRVIFLELPMEKILKWDLFIKNHTSLTQEELLEDLKNSIISPEMLSKLLIDLKEYNKKTKEKISLVGIDYSIGSTQINLLLHDYLYYLNEQSQNPLVDSLATLLYRQKTDSALYFFSHHPEITSEFDPIGLKVFEYILKYQNQQIAIPDCIPSLGPYKARDYFMAHIVIEIVENCIPKNSKAVIYAHWAHINNIDQSTFPAQSMGAYLKHKYKNQYYSIALLAGKGTVTGLDSISLLPLAAIPLNTPPQQSIENLCLQQQEKSFFFEGKILKENIMLIRDIGNSLSWYDWHALNQRTDGYIFIRNNHGFKVTSGWIEPKNSEQQIKRNIRHQQEIIKRLNSLFHCN